MTNLLSEFSLNNYNDNDKYLELESSFILCPLKKNEM
jgi:hypothetical protein